MDIMELGAIGELVGGVAVLATLVYLSLQIRQSNTNARAASRQTLIDTLYNFTFEIGRDRELCRIVGEGIADFEALSDDDKAQFSFLEGRFLGNVYNGILLHQEGLLDSTTLDTFAGFIGQTLRCKGAAAWFSVFPNPPELAAYIDDYMARHPDLPAIDQSMPYLVRSWGDRPKGQLA